MVATGAVHCFVFLDPGLQLRMHVAMHDVLNHVVQELEREAEAVAHSVEMHSNVGFVDYQPVHDGLLLVIAACILASVRIVRQLVVLMCVSKGYSNS